MPVGRVSVRLDMQEELTKSLVNVTQPLMARLGQADSLQVEVLLILEHTHLHICEICTVLLSSKSKPGKSLVAGSASTLLV